MIRFCDIIISLLTCIMLIPLYLIISVIILIDSRGSIFYIQKRVGKDNIDFNLIKFRTMFLNSDKIGLLTVGNDDKRITKSGKFLRRSKLDELPQLINVLKGDMSLVGPRPEVRKFVDLYTNDQIKVLSIRPGITDYASVEYSEENEILGRSLDPEKVYIEEIMQDKIRLNIKFVNNPTFYQYFKI
ncbi:MAG: sugar transferase, partial [bacterium]|nr:sugar transferase [bacterium]